MYVVAGALPATKIKPGKFIVILFTEAFPCKSYIINRHPGAKETILIVIAPNVVSQIITASPPGVL